MKNNFMYFVWEHMLNHVSSAYREYRVENVLLSYQAERYFYIYYYIFHSDLF